MIETLRDRLAQLLAPFGVTTTLIQERRLPGQPWQPDVQLHFELVIRADCRLRGQRVTMAWAFSKRELELRNQPVREIARFTAGDVIRKMLGNIDNELPDSTRPAPPKPDKPLSADDPLCLAGILPEA